MRLGPPLDARSSTTAPLPPAHLGTLAAGHAEVCYPASVHVVASHQLQLPAGSAQLVPNWRHVCQPS